MTKIKHIALTTQDPNKTAAFTKRLWVEEIGAAQMERCSSRMGTSAVHLELEN